MLKALVAAAEATLNTRTPSVAVAAFDTTLQSAKEDIRSALRDLGIHGRDRFDHVVRQVALTIGINGNYSYGTFQDDLNYHEDSEQLFMSVEYTRHSLAVFLWSEYSGALDADTRLISRELGHDAMTACRNTSKNEADCHDTLKRGLLHASDVPGHPENEEIRAVLVFGERANDNFLSTAIRQAMEERFPNGASVTIGRAEPLSPDPTFAGSRAMAMADLRMREYELGKQQSLNDEL